MKTTILKMSLALLFLTMTAMCCYMDEDFQMNEIPCSLSFIELSHLDNSGEEPVPSENKEIKKEAYMLEITLKTDAVDEESYNNRFILSDSIAEIKIYADKDLNLQLPAGTDLSAYFLDDPRSLGSGKLTDRTAQGDFISILSNPIGKIYKVLMADVQPGTYCFKVELTTAKGNIMEQESDPVTLY